MKLKIIFLGAFLFSTGIIFSQNKKGPISIISSSAAIKKYHGLDELKRMQKGELLALYDERLQVLVRTLPYIALATKPGMTVSDLAIPLNSENKKAMEAQTEGTNAFLELTHDYQKKMMPYADKDNLISAIIFYENTMKSLHEFNDL
ncbi:MAG: hypothetical protein ABIP68_04060 [Ferruginibacter sp.]